MNYDAFRRWLKSRSYADSTMLHTLQDVDYAEDLLKAGKPVPQNIHHSIKRYRDFAAATGEDQENAARLEAACVTHKGLPGGRKSKSRKLEAVSFQQDDWRVLATAIEEDPSHEARVLEVLISHGMRVGDILRIDEKTVLRACVDDQIILVLKGDKKKIFSTNGTQDVWRKLYYAMEHTQDRPSHGWKSVGEWLCPDSEDALLNSCAKQRVDRKLKALGKVSGTHGRIHLHRIRRTIAVQALRVEKDLGKVQQLLQHENPMTTMRYVDEARTEEVGALQDKIRRTYR